ncbi:MAG: hypothetical protein NWR12_09665, partial [Haliea sp.]|nr:hypothetical protein [Haliea sp.]
VRGARHEQVQYRRWNGAGMPVPSPHCPFANHWLQLSMSPCNSPSLRAVCSMSSFGALAVSSRASLAQMG